MRGAITTIGLSVLKREEISFERELAQDMIELITVFPARLYSARSKKNKRLIDGIANVIDEVK
jgi:predicted site-specific integrase-resolvase